MYYINYYGEDILEVSKDDIVQLMKKGLIVKHSNGSYIFNKDNPELNYLFNPKIKIFKKKIYLREINKVHCVCSICKAPHSFHVSPKIEEDGSVNFKEVVCVCRNCRTNKLKKRDILTPQFKQKINWSKEMRVINQEIADKKILDKANYIQARKDLIRIEKFLKLILPPLPEAETLSEELKKMKERLSDMGDLDLKDASTRIAIRKFLSMEANSRCPVCGNYTAGKDMTIDHIVAKSIGGRNQIHNFIGICHLCNLKKGSKPIIQYLCEIELNKMPYRILQEAYEQQQYWKENIKELKTYIENIK